MMRCLTPVIAAVLLGAGCGSSGSTEPPPPPPSPPSPPGPDPVATMEVVPDPATVQVGQTVQLTAVPKGADGSVLDSRAITWATSSDAVATVNGAGQVTAVAVGDVTITATSEEVDGTAALSVIPFGFRIRSPDIEILPSQQIQYCYYFRTPNEEQLAIKAWRSSMPAVTLDMTLFLTDDDVRSPGTQSSTNCGHLLTTGNLAVAAYTAYQAEARFDFPADDGTGVPVAQLIPANQAGYLRLHYFNATSEPITVHVDVEGLAYPANTAVTRADPYVTFNGNLSVPPGASTASYDCATPAGAQFFSMTTHSHRQSVATFIKDDAAIVFQSSDYANPGTMKWDQTPFYAFTSGQLTYQCDYVNPTNLTFNSGNSPFRDEQCVAIAYFFPSTGPWLCYDDLAFPPSAGPMVSLPGGARPEARASGE